MIKNYCTALFTCPYMVLYVLGGISIMAIGAALVSQYGFGMHPCYLCLWQRIPYAVVILLAGLGLIATKNMGAKYGAFNIALCGIALLINSAIAFYHVGVEQKWWGSTCALPNLANLTPDEIMATIKNAPAVSCGDIQFEMFGISMAGYNVVLCGILGIYALIAFANINGRKCHPREFPE